jgi:hypothetical protein
MPSPRDDVRRTVEPLEVLRRPAHLVQRIQAVVAGPAVMLRAQDRLRHIPRRVRRLIALRQRVRQPITDRLDRLGAQLAGVGG